MEEEQQTNEDLVKAADKSTAVPTPIASDTSTKETAGAESDQEEEIDMGPPLLELLQTVPYIIKAYILSKTLTDRRQMVYDKHQLNEEEIAISMDTELGVYFGGVELNEFPDVLWSRLPWEDSDEERARLLALDILGHLLLPAQSFVGDISALIYDLNGSAQDYPDNSLEDREMSFDDGAAEIAQALPFAEELESRMQGRLRHIIASRLRGIRDDMETKNMLTKAAKTGGLELSVVQAEEVIRIINAKSEMTSFVEQVIETVHAEHAGAEDSVETGHDEYSAEKIREIYAGTPEERQNLTSQYERFVQDAGGRSETIREHLYGILFPAGDAPPDEWDVLAGLIALAQTGGLRRTIENDERYKEIVREELRESAPQSLAHFEANPGEKKYMNMLLQILLEDVANFEEKDAARYGLRIAHTLKKQGDEDYVDLVAFDLDKGEFAWADHVL